MSTKVQLVAMIGAALDSKGGIASQCAAYSEAGLFRRLNIIYLSSFVSAGPVRRAFQAIVALVRLFLLLRARRVSVVHVHMATGQSVTRKAAYCALARLFGTPFIVHLHSGKMPDYFEQQASCLMRRVFRWCMRHAAWVFVLSTENSNWLRARALRLDRISFLPNFVTIESKLSTTRPANLILFLGRLEEAKGVGCLLGAFKAVVPMLSDVRLVLCGEGDRQRYESWVRANGLTDKVEFPGWVAGAEKQFLLSQASAFVLPSRFEGLPMGILEAMASGVPCIASAVGGIPDLITDQVSGLLVPPDDQAALTRALLKLLSSEQLREQLASNAQANLLARFSSDAVERALQQAYTAAAGSSNGAGLRSKG